MMVRSTMSGPSDGRLSSRFRMESRLSAPRCSRRDLFVSNMSKRGGEQRHEGDCINPQQIFITQHLHPTHNTRLQMKSRILQNEDKSKWFDPVARSHLHSLQPSCVSVGSRKL